MSDQELWDVHYEQFKRMDIKSEPSDVVWAKSWDDGWDGYDDEDDADDWA